MSNIPNMIINGKYRQQDTIIQQIQVWADEVVNGMDAAAYESVFKEEIYKPFLTSIDQYQYTHKENNIRYNFNEIIGIFEKMIKYGSEDKMFTIPRWIHQMSIDIHTLNKPVFELSDEQKTSISNAEIIAATEDATYGHDFKRLKVSLILVKYL